MVKWDEQQFIDQNRGEFVHEQALKAQVDAQDKVDEQQNSQITSNKQEADANQQKNVEQDADLAALKKEADANRDQNVVQDGEIKQNTDSNTKQDGEIKQNTDDNTKQAGEIKQNTDSNTKQDGEITQLTSMVQACEQTIMMLMAGMGQGTNIQTVTITKYNQIDLTQSANGSASGTVASQPLFTVNFMGNGRKLSIVELRCEVNVAIGSKQTALNDDGTITLSVSGTPLNVGTLFKIPVTLYASDGTHAWSAMSTITVTNDSGNQTWTLAAIQDKYGQPTELGTYFTDSFIHAEYLTLQLYGKYYDNRNLSFIPGNTSAPTDGNSGH